MDRLPVGEARGKLIKDPAIWYAANAIIDGVDPYARDWRGQILFAVYKRRLHNDAMRAVLSASAVLDPKCVLENLKVLQASLLPVDPNVEKQNLANMMAELEQLEKSPIPFSAIRSIDFTMGTRAPQ